MLEIQNLHVKFHNQDREAVSGVSLTIQDGEILGLVGESGSGKSVTAMSVAGLLPRKRCDYTCWTGRNCSTRTGPFCGRFRERRSAWCFRSPKAAWTP